MSIQLFELQMGKITLKSILRFRLDLVVIILVLCGIFVLASELGWDNYIPFVASIAGVLLASAMSAGRYKQSRE